MTIALPQGFIIRPATLDDLNAIAELLITCERADYGESESMLESTAAWILSVWQCPGFTLEKDSYVVIALGDRCAGYVTVWHPENDLTELVASPRVHPDYCSRSIGTYLLRHGEVRARELPHGGADRFRCSGYNNRGELAEMRPVLSGHFQDAIP